MTSAGLGSLVLATIDHRHGSILVQGRDLPDLMELAEIAHKATTTGVAIDVDDLGDLEVACAVRGRRLRVQRRKT